MFIKYIASSGINKIYVSATLAVIGIGVGCLWIVTPKAPSDTDITVLLSEDQAENEPAGIEKLDENLVSCIAIVSGAYAKSNFSENYSYLSNKSECVSRIENRLNDDKYNPRGLTIDDLSGSKFARRVSRLNSEIAEKRWENFKASLPEMIKEAAKMCNSDLHLKNHQVCDATYNENMMHYVDSFLSDLRKNEENGLSLLDRGFVIMGRNQGNDIQIFGYDSLDFYKSDLDALKDEYANHSKERQPDGEGTFQ